MGVAVSGSELPGQVQADCDTSTDKKEGNSIDTSGDNIEYVTFQANSDLKNHEEQVLTQNEDPGGGYITFEGTKASPKDSEDQHFLGVSKPQILGDTTNNENNLESENLCSGYVTIE